MYLTVYLKNILLSLFVCVQIGSVESVARVAEEASETKEDNEDGGPDHEACQEPHEDDPDEGEDAGSYQSYSNHPVCLCKIIEHSLCKVSNLKKASKSVQSRIDFILVNSFIGGCILTSDNLEIKLSFHFNYIYYTHLLIEIYS